MDRLSIFLSLIIGSVTTGMLVIAVLVMGWYSWQAIGIAAVIGFIIAWPVSYVVSRRIKRHDAGWDETKVDGLERPFPHPDAPEV